MNQILYDAVVDSPVITAVKDEEGLEKALQMDSEIIFILYGTVCNISTIVSKVKECGKIAMVHVDLIEGLSSKEEAVNFLHQYTEADGIISTRLHMIKKAKSLNMFTVLRIFVIDSMALNNVVSQYQAVHPDLIEILPGIMPKIIRRVCEKIKTPVIAGGLISEKDDIIKAIDAGATAISTTNESVWSM